MEFDIPVSLAAARNATRVGLERVEEGTIHRMHERFEHGFGEHVVHIDAQLPVATVVSSLYELVCEPWVPLEPQLDRTAAVALARQQTDESVLNHADIALRQCVREKVLCGA